MKYLNHYTIETKHNRESPRSEVLHSMPMQMSYWFKKAISQKQTRNGRHIPIEGFDPFHCSVRKEGEDRIICQVVKIEASGFKIPQVSFTVFRNKKALPKEFCYQHFSDKNTPDAPLLAVTMLYKSLDLNSTKWLGDFERCVAWTWLEVFK